MAFPSRRTLVSATQLYDLQGTPYPPFGCGQRPRQVEALGATEYAKPRHKDAPRLNGSSGDFTSPQAHGTSFVPRYETAMSPRPRVNWAWQKIGNSSRRQAGWRDRAH